MLRATQNSDIPVGDVHRIRPDDSERTKNLKLVMKSIAKYSTGGFSQGANESAQAAGQLIMKKQKEEEEEIRKAVELKEWDPCERGFLSAQQEKRLRSTVLADEEVTEMGVGSEFSELLRHSSGVVSDLSNSLSSSSPAVVSQQKPPHIDTSPIDICLVSRKEAEDIVAGGATDHQRREQAAWSWVRDNVKFKDLDALGKQIKGDEKTQDSQKFEELRKVFEPHHKYHNCLVFLTDHSLIDDSIWQRAVQEARYPTEVETEAAPKAQLSFFAPKALSKTGGKGSSSRQNVAPGTKTSNRISWANAAAGPGSLGGRAAGLKHSQSGPVLR